jgi:hypothetical protein
MKQNPAFLNPQPERDANLCDIFIRPSLIPYRFSVALSSAHANSCLIHSRPPSYYKRYPRYQRSSVSEVPRNTAPPPFGSTPADLCLSGDPFSFVLRVSNYVASVWSIELV